MTTPDDTDDRLCAALRADFRNPTSSNYLPPELAAPLPPGRYVANALSPPRPGVLDRPDLATARPEPVPTIHPLTGRTVPDVMPPEQRAEFVTLTIDQRALTLDDKIGALLERLEARAAHDEITVDEASIEKAAAIGAEHVRAAVRAAIGEYPDDMPGRALIVSVLRALEAP